MLPKKKIEGVIEYWIKSSEEDIKTMQALYKSRRYAFCLFLGHLILEKALKALVVKATQSQAPKIHNLRSLVRLSQIELNLEEEKLIAKVNEFNMEARYPEEKKAFYQLCNKEYIGQFYHPIISLYKKLCLKTKLKN